MIEVIEAARTVIAAYDRYLPMKIPIDQLKHAVEKAIENAIKESSK